MQNKNTQLEKLVPKEIQMEFYNFSKKQLQMIYERFEFQIEAMELFLINSKQSHIEKVVEEFEKWDEILQPPIYQSKMMKLLFEGQFKAVVQFLKGRMSQQDFLLYEKNEEQKIQYEESKLDIKQIEQDSLIFTLPHNVLLSILDQLDPPSLYNFSATCSEFLNLIKNDPISDNLFKKFSRALFKEPLTRISAISPFDRLIEHVNQNPTLFSENIINEVNDNPRNVIWGDFPEYQGIVDKGSQLKQIGKMFSNFKQCFEHAPRVHYCGIYAVIERYIKFGEADMSSSYAPCHLIEYFRYLRFWPHGTVTMLISTKKLKKPLVLRYFSKEYPEQEYQNNPFQMQQQKEMQIIHGEFVVDLDQIYIKTLVGSTMFNYWLKIIQHQKGPSMFLQVKANTMRSVGDTYVHDLRKKNEGLKFYHYKHIEDFRDNLPTRIQGWKQVVY